MSLKVKTFYGGPALLAYLSQNALKILPGLKTRGEFSQLYMLQMKWNIIQYSSNLGPHTY